MPTSVDLRLLPLFVASAVSLALGVIAWRRRAPGARAFAILLMAIAEWATTYAFEMLAPDVSSKLVWDQLSYIGSATVGPAWLLFTLSYTEWQPRRDRRPMVLLLVMALLFDQALVWTDQGRALMWTFAGVDNLDFSMPLRFEYGPAYWVMLLYTYAVLFSGVWLIARTLVQSGRLYSRQALSLLLGVAAPLVANVFYQADLVGTIDPTPFAFTFTGLAFFWGFQRFRFLDLAPVARNSIFQVLRDAVLVLDPRDRVVDVNPAAELVLGRAANAAVGRPLQDVSAELSVLVNGIVNGPAETLEIAFVDAASADLRHYDVQVSAMLGRDSCLTGRVIVLSDITIRKAAEESERASHQFVQEVIANAGEGIVVYDRALRLVMWNPFMHRITGLSAVEMLGTPALELVPELTERVELLAQALEGNTVQSADMPYTIPKTGESGWYTATYAPRRDASGRPDGVIGILHDITDRKRAEEVLSHQALHDELTDLPNRASAKIRLGQAIREAHRTQSGLALLVIDLDRFKDVNDNLGHGSGDLLLQELGRRWQEELREGDTLARLGGDEFAVVLPTTSGPQGAGLVVDRLQRAVLRPFVLDGHTVSVGASIGIALYPEHGRDTETLLRHADAAMYLAKRSGNMSATYAVDDAADYRDRRQDVGSGKDPVRVQSQTGLLIDAA